MRLAFVLVLCATSGARAEPWLDLAPIPHTAALEPAFQLDRYIVHESWCDFRRWGARHTLGLGVVSHPGSNQASGDAAYAAGTGSHEMLLAFSTEARAVGSSVRGRHEGRLEVRNLVGGRAPRFALALAGVAEHGPARGLAPIWLGHGRPITADGRADGALVLGHDPDVAWLAGVEAAAGGTWWDDGPIERASRRSVGIHVGLAPIDDGIPRGSIDVLRARVERVTLGRAIAGRGAAVGDAAVRIVEVGTGFRELTYHVHQDLLAIFAADAGVVRLDADTADMAISGSMVRIQIGATVKTVRGRRGDVTTRRLGVGFANEPGYTADGRTLTSDKRLTAMAGIETSLVSATASGGVSVVTAVAGDAPADRSVLRYGGGIESYLAIGGGFELGGHATATFEPHSIDPWATPRTRSYEAGALLRWRGGSP